MAKITDAVTLRSLFFMILLKTVAFFKVNLVVGPLKVFFSATHIVMPLTGAFGGLMTTATVIGLSTLLKVVFGLSYAPYLITYHIPSFMASAYWAYDHWLVRLAIPVACIMLFIAHPVGFSASPYTLYWLIPIMVYLFNIRSIFAYSLSSTMVAHAVGSVIWMYTVPMTVAQWYALIPVVAFERLFFAIAMTASYHVLATIFATESKALGNKSQQHQHHGNLVVTEESL